MKFKRVFFDLDGTLTDSSEGIFKCAIHTFNYFNLPVPNETELKKFIGPPLRDTFLKYGFTKQNVEDAVRVYRERYNTIGKYENKPYSGVIELLTALTERGVDLYIATSKPEPTTLDILKKFDLLKYFKGVAGATFDGKRDSKTSVLQYLLTIASSSNTVMVGDTVYDIIGANDCNLPSIAVGYGYGVKQDMLDAGAIYYAPTVEDLKNYLIYN